MTIVAKNKSNFESCISAFSSLWGPTFGDALQ